MTKVNININLPGSSQGNGNELQSGMPDGVQVDVGDLGKAEGNPFDHFKHEIEGALNSLGDDIKKGISALGDQVKSSIQSAGKSALDAIRNETDHALGNIKGEVDQGLGAIDQTKDHALDVVKKAGDDVAANLKEQGADITEGFKDAYTDVKAELVKDFEDGVKAVVTYAERHTLAEVADIAKKFESLGADFLPDLGVGIGPVGFTVNLKDDLDNIVKYAEQFADAPPDPGDVDTYLQLLNDFAPDEVHIDVTITADALVIGIDAVDFTLSWPVKDRLPEIEDDLRALWDGISAAEQSGEDAADAGEADIEGDVDG